MMKTVFCIFLLSSFYSALGIFSVCKSVLVRNPFSVLFQVGLQWLLDYFGAIRAAKRAKLDYEEGVAMLKKYEIIEKKLKKGDHDEGDVDLE